MKTLKSLLAFAILASQSALALPDLPKAFADGGAALIGDTAYVGLGSLGAEFYSLNLADDKALWEAVPEFIGKDRSQPVVASVDGKLYVFGGLQKNEKGELQIVNDAHVYDPATKTWNKLPTRSPQAIAGTSAFTRGDKIYFVGGVNYAIFNGYFQDYVAAGDDKAKQEAVMNPYFEQRVEDYFFNPFVLSYQPSTNKWLNEGLAPFSGRAGAAVSLIDDKVYVGNGEVKPGLRTAEVELGSFDDKGVLSFTKLPNLIKGEQDLQEGLAGAYSGGTKDYYLLAGGANFTGARAAYDAGELYAHKGKTRYYDPHVYVFKDGAWSIAGKLPVPSGYGASLNYQGDVIFIGGKDKDGNLNKAYRVSYDGKALTIK